MAQLLGQLGISLTAFARGARPHHERAAAARAQAVRYALAETAALLQPRDPLQPLTPPTATGRLAPLARPAALAMGRKVVQTRLIICCVNDP